MVGRQLYPSRFRLNTVTNVDAPSDPGSVRIEAIPGVPDIHPGDDLAAILLGGQAGTAAICS